MGILKPSKLEQTPTSAKRKSVQDALATLGPLKKEGTVGFSGFRDRDRTAKPGATPGKKTIGDDMESDSDDDDDDGAVGKMEDVDEVEIKKENGLLSPEDAERSGQLAEGVRKIKVCSSSTLCDITVANTYTRSSSGNIQPSH